MKGRGSIFFNFHCSACLSSNTPKKHLNLPMLKLSTTTKKLLLRRGSDIVKLIWFLCGVGYPYY